VMGMEIDASCRSEIYGPRGRGRAAVMLSVAPPGVTAGAVDGALSLHPALATTTASRQTRRAFLWRIMERSSFAGVIDRPPFANDPVRFGSRFFLTATPTRRERVR